MRLMSHVFFSLCAFLCMSVSAFALEEMSDAELDDITGTAGYSLTVPVSKVSWTAISFARQYRHRVPYAHPLDPGETLLYVFVRSGGELDSEEEPDLSTSDRVVAAGHLLNRYKKK